MNKYFKTFITNNCDTDEDGFLRVDRILAHMAETSTLHSNALGLSIDEIRKNHYGWMLINWELEIEEYPRLNDTINLVTWTSGFNKFYARREFLMLDLKANIIAKASSLWVFLDINKRKPIRIPTNITKKYSILEEKNFSEFSRIEIQGELTFNSDEFKVNLEDLDENNHVNNIKYIEWLFLGLSDMQKEYKIRKLAINYKKELLMNDCVHTQIVEGKDANILYHKILTEDNLNALACSFWKKKETSN